MKKLLEKSVLFVMVLAISIVAFPPLFSLAAVEIAPILIGPTIIGGTVNASSTSAVTVTGSIASGVTATNLTYPNDGDAAIYNNTGATTPDASKYRCGTFAQNTGAFATLLQNMPGGTAGDFAHYYCSHNFSINPTTGAVGLPDDPTSTSYVEIFGSDQGWTAIFQAPASSVVVLNPIPTYQQNLLTGAIGSIKSFTPEQYGCVPGGSDCTAAIQSAITAAYGAYNATTGTKASVNFTGAIYGITGILLEPNVVYNFGQAQLKRLSFGTTVASNSILRTIDAAPIASASGIGSGFTANLSSAAVTCTGGGVATGASACSGTISTNSSGIPTALSLSGGLYTSAPTGISGAGAGTWSSFSPIYGEFYGSYLAACQCGGVDNIEISGGTFNANGYYTAANILRLENVRHVKMSDMTVIHSPAVTAGSFVVGNRYVIQTVGTTSFTSIGASSNAYGIQFTATGAGSGTGTATATGYAYQIGGRDIEARNLRVLGGNSIYQDGIHITHGDKIHVNGGYVESGDDAIALGIDGNGQLETWDDEALTNVTIEGTRVLAQHGTIKTYYGLSGTGNFFTGTYRGQINGVTENGIVGNVGILSNGGIYFVDTTRLYFTAPVSAATSATMASSPSGTQTTWAGASGTYDVVFDSSVIRQVTLTNGASTVTWTGAASAAAAFASVGMQTHISNINISGFNLNVGSASSDGLNCNGVYGLFGTDIHLQGVLNITDTANGNHCFAGSVFLTNYGDYQVKYPAIPAAGGLQLRDSQSSYIHNSWFNGGLAAHGAVELFGSLDTRITDSSFIGIPTSGYGINIGGVGSGARPNELTATGNSFYKASGATTTRALVQGSTTSLINFSFNDAHGGANALGVDALWNSGTTATTFNAIGNIANATAANVIVNNAQTIIYGTNITPNLFSGGFMNVGTLTGTMAIAAPTSANIGATITFKFTQDATGGRTVTWDTIYHFVSAAWVDAIITTDANKISYISFTYDGTNWIQQAPNRWVAQ